MASSVVQQWRGMFLSIIEPKQALELVAVDDVFTINLCQFKHSFK
jgi:hypothetical protein